MELVQILGLTVCGFAAIGATILGWKWIDSKRIERSESLRTRAEHNEKIVHDKTWEMWQNERQLRADAETKLGIVQHQLKLERAKTDRLERLLSGVKVSDIAS
jgi:hypothetical protein